MKKVLIIDDEDMVRKTLSNKFSPKKYNVFEAKSLNEAFGILNSEPDRKDLSQGRISLQTNSNCTHCLS